MATESLLAEFLKEIRDVTLVTRELEQATKRKTPVDSIHRPEVEGEKLPDINLENAERALYMLENDEHDAPHEEDMSDIDPNDTGGTRLLCI